MKKIIQYLQERLVAFLIRRYWIALLGITPIGSIAYYVTADEVQSEPTVSVTEINELRMAHAKEIKSLKKVIRDLHVELDIKNQVNSVLVQDIELLRADIASAKTIADDIFSY